jgi:hypothetical protein
VLPRSQIARAAFITLAGALLFLGTAGTAVADGPYLSSLSVSDSTPTPGAAVTVRAGGLAPNRPTRVLFDGQPIATTTTNANGVASRLVTIPVDASNGDHLIGIARAATTRGNGAAPKILLSTSIDVERGGSALSSPDGTGITGYVVAVGIAGAVAIALILGRRRSART